jgi:hypothetical protein
MIGRVDGTAACNGGRGFVFLFNPNYRKLDAEFVLDASIGLEKGGPFILAELYPERGLLVGHPQNGTWKLGDRVRFTVDGNQAVVLEIKPAAAVVSHPVLFNVRGTALVRGNQLELANVEAETGSQREISVRLPGSTKIGSLTVNGVGVQFRQAGDLVTASVRFSGEAFTRSQPLWTYDPAFSGGTIKASFQIPARIFDQLRLRRKAWAVPYTEDDLIAPWLGSYRLLLYAQIAEPDDSRAITMTIDGKPVRVQKAYNNVYGNNRRTFLGNYVDVSSLDPDKEHVIEVTLPQLAPGRFQGLFFENVEPEYTRSVVK